VHIAPHNPDRRADVEKMREALSLATALHCVSDETLAAVRRLGVDPRQARVIRPAVDTQAFSPATGQPTDTLRLVMVGSLIWRKGYEYALAAVRNAVSQGAPAHLTICGDGPERERILFTISDLGLTEHVSLAGAVSATQVRDILRASDAFLLTSLGEGISNAALEAMACGLPVLTTDCGGMREAVSDGVEGTIVGARDIGALTTGILRLWKEPEVRRRMGMAARERAVRDFDLSRQLDEFQALLLSIVNQTRDAAG
jgi:glycosyltransferase involved in cell wall biosynthesis